VIFSVVYQLASFAVTERLMVCMILSAICVFSGTGRAILLRHLGPGGHEVGIGSALHEGPVLVDDSD
jgi:hypothetical protein